MRPEQSALVISTNVNKGRFRRKHENSDPPSSARLRVCQSSFVSFFYKNKTSTCRF